MRPLSLFCAVVAILATGPAFAWAGHDPRYPSRWWEHNAQSYYGGPYGDRYNGYRDYGVDAGVMDIAICPPGYHLGRAPGLCWPD